MPEAWHQADDGEAAMASETTPPQTLFHVRFSAGRESRYGQADHATELQRPPSSVRDPRVSATRAASGLLFVYER